jgi:hypothetical protein
MDDAQLLEVLDPLDQGGGMNAQSLGYLPVRPLAGDAQLCDDALVQIVKGITTGHSSFSPYSSEKRNAYLDICLFCLYPHCTNVRRPYRINILNIL